MSTETDIVEKLQVQFFTRMEHGIVVVDREIIRECAAEITKLRAERDAAARDMRERCAKVAEDEKQNSNHGRQRGDQAGFAELGFESACEHIAESIRGLSVIATQREGVRHE